MKTTQQKQHPQKTPIPHRRNKQDNPPNMTLKDIDKTTDKAIRLCEILAITLITGLVILLTILQ